MKDARIESLFAACRSSAITQWAEGQEQLSAEPWLAYISTTNLCNNRCRVCAITSAMRKDRGVMSMATFERIVSQLPQSIKKVYLFKQGEPFINQNLEAFVAYLRAARPEVYISIHTNGILAERSRIEKILPLIDALGISVGATSRETYQQVHATDSFDKVMANLKDISEVALAIPKERRPHIFIDYVQQLANRQEKEAEVVSFFSSAFPGLSSVDFHWVFNFQGEIAEGNMGVYENVSPSQFPCCVFPWSAVTFCWDGRVSYCFVEPRENRFLGDINKQDFAEIWNGAEYRGFRGSMIEKRFEAMSADGFHCSKCAWLWSMASQSPRNLAQGYSPNLGDIQNNPSFGNIMDMRIEDILNLGMTAYLKGEIHQALGILAFLDKLDLDPDTRPRVAELMNMCASVLKNFKDLPLWRARLQAEGILPENKTCKYYPIGE